MANRKNTFLIKRSNTPGKIPTSGDLQLGELALNTADVILYASGTTANSILPIGWDRVARTGDTMTGTLYVPSVSATTITLLNATGTSISTLGIDVNGRIVSGATGGGSFTGGTVTGATVFTSSVSAATYYNLPTTTDTNAFHNSGDTFGVNASLGTNDAYPLLLKTSGTTRMVIGNDGYVGINSPTTIPDATLYVKGIGSNYQYAFQLVGPSGNNIMTAFNIGQINFGVGSNTSYFDDYRLRVGGAPGVNAGTLTTKGVDSTASYYGFNVYNANQDDLFNVRNDGRISVNGNLVVTGSTSVNSISATTYYGDGSQLTGISASGGGSGITGATFINNNLILTNNTGGTVSTLINTFTGLTATTISASTYYGIPDTIGIGFDGQGGVISTGNTTYRVMGYNGRITGWDLVATTTGTCVIDIWKIASGSTLPTVANSITDAAKPTLTTGYISSDTNLTSWTSTSFNAGDIIAYTVDSATTVTKITLSLRILKQ